MLHHQVCIFAADRLAAALATWRHADSEIAAGLDALQREMTRQCQAGTPWRARDALDVLTSVDMLVWTALLGLIDECPVIHAALHASGRTGIHSVRASDFEFIACNRQIALARNYMRALPDTLRA
jgi:hypothetical protein